MEILASVGRTISIAALLIGVICIFVFYRGMRSMQGYAAVASAGFAAGFAPALVDHDRIRGIGVGLSAGILLMLLLRLPFSQPTLTGRSHGRVALVDWLTLAEVVLSLVSGALWAFLDDRNLWLAVVCFALVLALLSVE